jgi:hypothetical protein
LRESLPGNLDVVPRSRPRLLLESMQYVDRFGAAGNVNHPVRSALVRHADLLCARVHRLEVVGLLAALHLLQLIARIVPRILRKFAQALERVPEETHGLHFIQLYPNGYTETARQLSGRTERS